MNKTRKLILLTTALTGIALTGCNNAEYDVIDATLVGGRINGTVRTPQHKYEFDSNADEFLIKNHDNNLEIIGRLWGDGTATATMTIDTDNINSWFEFSNPKIDGRIKLTCDIEWNGKYGLRFKNIRGENFRGDIELFDDGARNINMTATALDMDLSFLAYDASILKNANFNLDLTGNLQFKERNFQSVKIRAAGTENSIQIFNVTADDWHIGGGVIDETGATALPLGFRFNDAPVFCLFSGTPEIFRCSDFVWNEFTGNLSVENNKYQIYVTSQNPMPATKTIIDTAKQIADSGTIEFKFSDAFGKINTDKNTFEITRNSFKELAPDLDLRGLNDADYTIAGGFDGTNLSDLSITIGGHIFFGTMTDKGITLRTDILSLDAFISQDYVDNYDELQFSSNTLWAILFDLKKNISLVSDFVVYNGDIFENFAFSLNDNKMQFSITDAARGSVLAEITQSGGRYDAKISMDKFIAVGNLLSREFGINISNTTITGDATLQTFGRIAYDIWENISGEIDVAFNGGYLVGIGTDEFFANAKNIEFSNAEILLSNALNGGRSELKNLALAGKYRDGKFQTTRPFALTLRHTNGNGNLEISDGKMTADITLSLRGTTPGGATPINFRINENGTRDFSLSQILSDLDIDYFRDFAATHSQY